jgi:hypothetical protein
MSNLCPDLQGAHHIHVSGLSVWVSPVVRPCPPGYVFPLPYGVAAFASWMFLFPLGIRPVLTVRVADLQGSPYLRLSDPIGVSMFHSVEMRLGWVLSILRGLGVPSFKPSAFRTVRGCLRAATL